MLVISMLRGRWLRRWHAQERPKKQGGRQRRFRRRQRKRRSIIERRARG